MTTIKSTLVTVKPSILAIAGILALLTAGCGQSPSPQSATKEPTSSPGETAVGQTTQGDGQGKAPAVAAPEKLPPPDPATVALAMTNSAAPVENRIHTISSADISLTEKAKALFVMFDGVAGQDQRKVALAAASYTDDTSYALVRDHLLNAKLEPQVLSVFMTHTLKRKNSIKLPALLELAQIDGHPLQREAQELLRAFLKTDHGTNWNAWAQSVKNMLVTNPN